MKKILTVAALLLSTSSVIFAGTTDTHEVKITARVASATVVSLTQGMCSSDQGVCIDDGDVSISKAKNQINFDFTGLGETKTESLNLRITSNKGYDLTLQTDGKLKSAKTGAEMDFQMKINDAHVQGDGSVAYGTAFSTNEYAKDLKLEVTIDSTGVAAADDYQGKVVINVKSR